MASRASCGWRGLCRDLFTGAGGQAFAIGRVAAAPLMLVGLSIPPAMLALHREVSLAELGVYWGGLGAAFMAMVQGTHASEPRGEAEGRHDA